MLALLDLLDPYFAQALSPDGAQERQLIADMREQDAPGEDMAYKMGLTDEYAPCPPQGRGQEHEEAHGR